MPIAATILAILFLGALAGTTLNFAGIFLGIPIVLLFVGALLGREQAMRQRRIVQMKRFRRDAQTRKSDFTAQDKRTMV